MDYKLKKLPAEELVPLPDKSVIHLPGGVVCTVTRVGRPSYRQLEEAMARIAPWLEAQAPPKKKEEPAV